MLKGICATVLIASAFTRLDARAGGGLGGYQNNESKMPGHYRWSDTANGGSSHPADGFRQHDVELRALTAPIDRKSLDGVRLLIIVDPDSPGETGNPKYIA